MYFIFYFCHIHVLYNETTALKKIYFAQTFQISTLCICTGPHESLFYFSCLLYYCRCFHLSIFASFDKEIRRGTSLLFCTEYVRNIHLFCSEQTCWKSETYIKPQIIQLKWILRWTDVSVSEFECIWKEQIHLILFYVLL